MSYVETLHDQRKARLARFAWAATHPKLKAKPITHDVPTRPYGEPEAVVIPIDPNAWAERQKERFKAPWFEIVDGPLNFEQQDPAPIKIEHVQRIVCRHYLMDRNDMLSMRRTKDACLPRHVAMYLCRQLTTRSLVEIGKRFCDRDHTTCIAAIRKISRMIGENIKFAEEVEDIRKKCEA